jgi:hypothetical protein
MTRIVNNNVPLACCFIALIPLLLLPIIPPHIAAILHIVLAAPITTSHLLACGNPRGSMADIVLSMACVLLGASAAILFLLSQQMAAHLCIGNALCTAAIHMTTLLYPGHNPAIYRKPILFCAMSLFLLGAVGMMMTPFIAQRMFQCAAFPLIMLYFEATKLPRVAWTEAWREADTTTSTLSTSNTLRQHHPLLFLKGPIPDFSKKKLMV